MEEPPEGSFKETLLTNIIDLDPNKFTHHQAYKKIHPVRMRNHDNHAFLKVREIPLEFPAKQAVKKE